MSLFDNLLDEREFPTLKIQPFHTVKEKGDEEVHKWLKDAIEGLTKGEVTRNHRLKANLAAYRGISHKARSSRSAYRNSERILTNRVERFVVNHLFDITETKVSQMTRLKPAIDILPTNDEYADKNAARATKMLMDHLWYINNIDQLIQDSHRRKKIFGETYLFIDWDEHAGDKHQDAGKVVEVDGKTIQVDEDQMTGDVCYEIEVPWRVLLERRYSFHEVEYCFRIKIEHQETLKKRYPDKAAKIKPDEDTYIFDYSTLDNIQLEDQVVVYEFWHKKTRECKKGAFIKFTKTTILEGGDHKFSHGKLPFIRLTDLDIPHTLHGVSQYEMVKQIQNMHNNLSTLLAKNIYMMGHAKWVMPKGACKLESLGNDNTIVQYQGPVAPQLLQVAPNPPEAYAFRDKLKEEMEMISGVHGTSRGQPPEGITAGVALQFLNEQETERASTEISKANQFIQQVAQMTLAVAGDFYEPDDGRMLRIVGKNNKFMIRHFDAANLEKTYDIRVQNGNALAETKAGKNQRIIETIQYKPDALSGEQVIELLELGNADKMVNLITVALQNAESENEDILEGRFAAPPEDFEDHIVHWRSHVKAVQSRSFKEEVPVEHRNKMIDHIAIHEFLMTEKAKENPTFQAKLAQLELFPLFWHEGFVPKSKEQQEAEVQGQTNRGEEVTGMIPATDAPPLPGEPGEENE